MLGSLACFAGLILSVGSSWLLSIYYFELAFSPDIGALAIAAFLIVVLTLVTGLLNMKGVLNKKPLEILRLEAG